MHSSAVVPRSRLSMGTSRQNSNGMPSAAQPSSKTRMPSASPSASVGKKSMATPYSPSSGRRLPHFCASLRKKRCGTWMRMPAPSPVLGSRPTPPRCSRLTSTDRASSMIWCERTPLRLAKAPMPQASCSNSLRYIDGSAYGRLPVRSVISPCIPTPLLHGDWFP